MNWDIKKFTGNMTLEQKQKMVSSYSEENCEHVDADNSVLHVILGEQDSFGPVCGFGYCKECYEQIKEKAKKELVTCDDCHQQVEVGNTIQWKWYDFYAPQGDEPLIICDECRKKDKHLKRVERDRLEREAEMDGYKVLEEDDYDIYD